MSLLQDALEFVRLFPEATVCGLVMAVVCAAFGVLVVLRRIVFVSIALSEAATLGLAWALVRHFPPLAGSALVSAAVVVLLALSSRRSRLPQDVLLGAIFLLASSASVLLVSQSGFGLEEVKAMLYGDLVVCGRQDRQALVLTGLPALAALLLFLRPTFLAFFDREAAQVMGIRCWFWEWLFFVLLGTVVSGAAKSGGALLVFCDLVVVPAAALLLTRRLWPALLTAMALGVATTGAGLVVAYRADLPCNPTLIGVACLTLAALVVARGLWGGMRALLYRTSGKGPV